tara:strand:- start:546 stop:1091 length:546 start_codon:yes stop_codon:yes gene_type:complete
LKEIIENKINSREFTFMELLKIDKLAEDLANETYEELTTQQRLDFAWEVKITTTGSAFGTLFRSATITSLRTAFSEALKEFMENAKVTSQGETKRTDLFESPAKEEFVPETVEELVLNKKLVEPDFPPEEDFNEGADDVDAHFFDLPEHVQERLIENDKKTTTFEPGSDGIGLPKGVRRIE